MGRRKRKKTLKPFCYYCNRTFEQEKVLIQHQKAKHFKCTNCYKKMVTAYALMNHMFQVHKESLKVVPHAKKGRDSVDLNIYGMQGVPAELIEERKLKENEESEQKNQKKQKLARQAEPDSEEDDDDDEEATPTVTVNSESTISTTSVKTATPAMLAAAMTNMDAATNQMMTHIMNKIMNPTMNPMPGMRPPMPNAPATTAPAPPAPVTASTVPMAVPNPAFGMRPPVPMQGMRPPVQGFNFRPPPPAIGLGRGYMPPQYMQAPRPGAPIGMRPPMPNSMSIPARPPLPPSMMMQPRPGMGMMPKPAPVVAPPPSPAVSTSLPPSMPTTSNGVPAPEPKPAEPTPAPEEPKPKGPTVISSGPVLGTKVPTVPASEQQQRVRSAARAAEAKVNKKQTPKVIFIFRDRDSMEEKRAELARYAFDSNPEDEDSLKVTRLSQSIQARLAQLPHRE